MTINDKKQEHCRRRAGGVGCAGCWEGGGGQTQGSQEPRSGPWSPWSAVLKVTGDSCLPENPSSIQQLFIEHLLRSYPGARAGAEGDMRVPTELRDW